MQWILACVCPGKTQRNNIDPKEYSNLVQHKLGHGGGKGKNIMICGLTNNTFNENL